MRKIIFSLILVSFVMLYSCAAYKSSGVIYPVIDSKINTKDYVVNVHTVQSKRMGQFSLSSDYSFKVHGDSATAYLPYYGNAQVAPVDVTAVAVSFSNKMTDFEQKRTRKDDGWDVKFSIESEIKIYQIYLQVYDSGRVYITVSSYDRDRISYIGELEVL